MAPCPSLSLSFSGTPPPPIPPPITYTRIPFARSHLPVQSLFRPPRQLELVVRWAVIPGTRGLRLRWAEATLDSIQLSEPEWLPGAVDQALVPGAADPAMLSEESSEIVLESEPESESVDLLEPSPVASKYSVELLEPSPVASKESVDLLEPSPVASLGLQSSGYYYHS